MKTWKPVLLHAAVVFIVALGAQLTLAGTHTASISTLVAFVTSSVIAAGAVGLHYLAGLVPVNLEAAVTAPLGTAGSVLLHSLLVFLVAFGGQLTSAGLHDTNASTLATFVTAAAISGVVAVASYLAGLVPNPTAVAQRKAAKNA